MFLIAYFVYFDDHFSCILLQRISSAICSYCSWTVFGFEFWIAGHTSCDAGLELTSRIDINTYTRLTRIEQESLGQKLNMYWLIVLNYNLLNVYRILPIIYYMNRCFWYSYTDSHKLNITTFLTVVTLTYNHFFFGPSPN